MLVNALFFFLFFFSFFFFFSLLLLEWFTVHNIGYVSD